MWSIETLSCAFQKRSRTDPKMRQKGHEAGSLTHKMVSSSTARVMLLNVALDSAVCEA